MSIPSFQNLKLSFEGKSFFATTSLTLEIWVTSVWKHHSAETSTAADCPIPCFAGSPSKMWVAFSEFQVTSTRTNPNQLGAPHICGALGSFSKTLDTARLRSIHRSWDPLTSASARQCLNSTSSSARKVIYDISTQNSGLIPKIIV